MNIEAQNLDSLRKLVRELQDENLFFKEQLKRLIYLSLIIVYLKRK